MHGSPTAFGLHASVVQGRPSSHEMGVATQTPSWQTSAVVQAEPSSQGAVLFACWQPLALSHASSVQTFLSSQSTAFPPPHTPASHASALVQASPSSHVTAFGRCVQPLFGSQASVVQGFWSSQVGGAPPLQAPATQASPSVHALASSQVTPSASGTKAHAPATQLSDVQAFLSSHSESTWHEHVHAPPPHAPPEQASPDVHAMPSSHVAAFGKWTHPVAASQLSSVQALPSSQPAAVGAWVQPAAGSHASAVHGTPSSHVATAPA